MSTDNFNRYSVLKVAFEELDRAKFAKTQKEEIAIRVIDESNEPFTLLVDQATAEVLYIGEARVGSLTAAPVWKIKKVSCGTIVSIKYASEAFNQIWDNRAGLTYE